MRRLAHYWVAHIQRADRRFRVVGNAMHRSHLKYFLYSTDRQFTGMPYPECDHVNLLPEHPVASHEFDVLLCPMQGDNIKPNCQQNVVAAGKSSHLLGMLGIFRTDDHKRMRLLRKADDLLAELRADIPKIAERFWSREQSDSGFVRSQGLFEHRLIDAHVLLQ